MMLRWISNQLGVVPIWRNRINEFRTSEKEKFFKDFLVQFALFASFCEFGELFAVLLAEDRVNRIVETGWCKGNADCQESIHLISFFLELVVDGGTMLELFGARDEEQYVGESLSCVRISPEHHICKTNVVVSLIMT